MFEYTGKKLVHGTNLSYLMYYTFRIEKGVEIMRGLIMMLVALWATGAQAEEDSVTVDEPIICLNAESMNDVVAFFRAGGYAFVNQWVDETARDCFRIGLTEVPAELTDRFVILEKSDGLNYGYIPLSERRIKFHMFFYTIRRSHGVAV